EIQLFLQQGEIIFGGVRDLLRAQFERLTNLQQHVLVWLAVLREPTTLDELMPLLVTPVPRMQLLEALEALPRRSLLERGQKQASFALKAVALEYLTARLVAEMSEEIEQAKPVRIIEYGIELAKVGEYVRQTQTRLLVASLLARLSNADLQSSQVTEQLYAML